MYKKTQSQIARPARHIHYSIIRLQLCQPHRPSPPRLIHPQAVQAIIQVVTRRDGREHLLHATPLVRDGVGVLQEIIVPGCRFGGNHLPRMQSPSLAGPLAGRVVRTTKTARKRAG
jgi:hypothetical protein